MGSKLYLIICILCFIGVSLVAGGFVLGTLTIISNTESFGLVFKGLGVLFLIPIIVAFQMLYQVIRGQD